MPHLQVEATTDQLLEAVAQLPPADLATFIERVLALRAERRVPAELQRRYDELVAARRAETLTPEAHAELLRLTDEIEQIEADRVAALAELARLRRTTIADLMQTLGIEPPAYA